MESSTQSNSLDPQAISALAYEIWESMGRPEGAAEQTWLEAERRLREKVPTGVAAVKHVHSAPEPASPRTQTISDVKELATSPSSPEISPSSADTEKVQAAPQEKPAILPNNQGRPGNKASVEHKKHGRR